MRVSWSRSTKVFGAFAILVLLYATHQLLIASKSEESQPPDGDSDSTSEKSLFSLKPLYALLGFSPRPQLGQADEDGTPPMVDTDTELVHVAPSYTTSRTGVAQTSQSSHGVSPTATATPLVSPSTRKVVWEDLKAALRECKPENPHVTFESRVDATNIDDKTDPPIPDYVQMSEKDIAQMKAAHTKFVKMIKSNAVSLDYQTGAKGVVTTAADDKLGSVVVALRMLRRTGCELPVEVYVEADDVVFSPMCATVLADLNATCIAMNSILGTDRADFEDNRYLNKVLALLFSSFDDNLFIDADNLPIVDPTPFLTSEPYSSNGIVAWPDFWYSTISAKHNIVTSTKLPPIKETVESGQLLLSKSRHAHTLLLAFYYNFYGPNYYYPLETQGAAGAGDKGWSSPFLT